MPLSVGFVDIFRTMLFSSGLPVSDIVPLKLIFHSRNWRKSKPRLNYTKSFCYEEIEHLVKKWWQQRNSSRFLATFRTFNVAVEMKNWKSTIETPAQNCEMENCLFLNASRQSTKIHDSLLLLETATDIRI